MNTRRGQALDVDSGVQGGCESQAVQGGGLVLSRGHGVSTPPAGGVWGVPQLSVTAPPRGLWGAAVPTGGCSPP